MITRRGTCRTENLQGIGPVVLAVGILIPAGDVVSSMPVCQYTRYFTYEPQTRHPTAWQTIMLSQRYVVGGKGEGERKGDREHDGWSHFSH